MATTALGLAPTTVTTDAQAPLGFQIMVPQAQDDAVKTQDQGDQLWTYVFNDEGSAAFAEGDIVLRDASATTQTMYGGIQSPTGTAAHAFSAIGVAQHAIAAGSYGFILTKGRGVCRTGSATVAQDNVLTSGGSTVGSAKAFANGTIGVIEMGWALEAGSATSTFDAYINCLGA